MLVTLIKALGASNKGKQENKIPSFVQESVFHHQPISIILIFRFYVITCTGMYLQTYVSVCWTK
jgi:hypothetical protein